MPETVFNVSKQILLTKLLIFYCFRTLCEDITHMSKTLCYQKRGLCEYEVERTLSCGHTHKMPCHINVATYKCNEFILTSFPYCGHDVILPCCTNVSEVTCCLPCEKRLEECGHICTLTCHVNKDPDHKEVSVYLVATI